MKLKLKTMIKKKEKKRKEINWYEKKGLNKIKVRFF